MLPCIARSSPQYLRVSTRLLHVAKPISLDPIEMMAIISRAPKYSPGEVLETLTRMSRHESANISLCDALARRVGQSAEEFFPTQIVEATRLFRSLGYADAALWSAIAGRSDDVLGTASPKRLVEFLEFVGDLQLPLRDQAIWSVARPSILAVLPHIRGGLGTVMESLAAHGCQDHYVVDALMAQIHSKLAFAFPSLASLPNSSDVISVLLQSDAVKGAIKELPPAHLLSLLYASALAGVSKDSQVVNDIANVLTFTASSLDLRQRRILWLSAHNMKAFHHLPVPSALPARMPWEADFECETIGAFQLPRNDDGKLVIFEPRMTDGPRVELMKRILKDESGEEITVESMMCF